jgi:NAD(P)H-flavin reductase
MVATLIYLAVRCVDEQNQPPLGWTEGVGYVEEDTIKKHLPFPPNENDLIVICGPPFFESLMCKTMEKLGYPRHTYFAYSNPGT